MSARRAGALDVYDFLRGSLPLHQVPISREHPALEFLLDTRDRLARLDARKSRAKPQPSGGQHT